MGFRWNFSLFSLYKNKLYQNIEAQIWYFQLVSGFVLLIFEGEGKVEIGTKGVQNLKGLVQAHWFVYKFWCWAASPNILLLIQYTMIKCLLLNISIFRHNLLIFLSWHETWQIFSSNFHCSKKCKFIKTKAWTSRFNWDSKIFKMIQIGNFKLAFHNGGQEWLYHYQFKTNMYY